MFAIVVAYENGDKRIILIYKGGIMNYLYIRILKFLKGEIKMFYSFRELPSEYKVKGQRLYAFDYATNNTEKSNALKAKPYKCEFNGWGDGGITTSDYCYKVKNNGERGKISVQAGSRHYALSHEEAVEGYNKLVMDTVGFLLRMAKVYESDVI